ncbi:hypothetical protein ACRAWD_09355 [Caulobacter segnis]
MVRPPAGQADGALDAAWEAIAETDGSLPSSAGPATAGARACGDLAAMARKVAAMTPRLRPQRPPAGFPPLDLEPEDAERPIRKLDRLKGGGRGRL